MVHRMTAASEFQTIIKKIGKLGIENTFHDLSDLAGPPVPDWASQKVLYEIYVRAWSPDNSFKAVQNDLARLKKLGIDMIWFMPIYPIGRRKRKGRRGCPYAVQNYFKVNPEYGTEQDFRDLVATAHQQGMYVLLDMVANHVAPDYDALSEHPLLVQRDRTGRAKRKIADWTDVIDVDYQQEFSRQHFFSIMKYWIEEFDVDGFRCDVAGMVPLDFWEWAVPRLNAIKPTLYWLAEWESPLLQAKAFHSTYDWSLYRLMRAVDRGREPASMLQQWIELKAASYPRNAQPLRFLENHDYPRAVSVFREESVLTFLALIFCLDGLPLIYNGQEIGAGDYPSLFEKEPIDWSRVDLRMAEAVQRLIRLRKEKKALSSKNYRFIDTGFSGEVVAFWKDDRILCVFNFSARSKKISINRTNEFNAALTFSTSGRSGRIQLSRFELFPHEGLIIEQEKNEKE